MLKDNLPVWAPIYGFQVLIDDAVWVDDKINLTDKMIENLRQPQKTVQNSFVQWPTMIKIGFVNVERILKSSNPAIKAQQVLESQFKPRETAIREFMGSNLELQKLKREFQEDLNLRRNQELQKVIQTANQRVREVALEKSLTIVFQSAVYVDPSLDITDEVLEKLSAL